MGGYGSGRWGGYRKKTTVQECLQLDVIQFYRKGLLTWEMQRLVFLQWKNAFIGCEVDTTDQAQPWVRLFYILMDQKVEHKISLQTTRPHFGGWRWWFICPLTTGGQPCGRRVRKLYLPPGALYFGCRHCYDLTYRSCQESNKRVSLLRRMFEDDPAAL